MKIILAEWGKYPLKREKVFGKNIIKCGLLRVLENMLTHPGGERFEVRIVITDCDNSTKLKYQSLIKNYSFIEDVSFRDNQGQDIGSYNFAYQRLLKENYNGNVIFMNSSVRGPLKRDWLKNYLALFHSDTQIGLCGITLNNQNYFSFSKSYLPKNPHVQSFFLLTEISLLKEVFPTGSLSGFNQESKKALIKSGEIGISTAFLNKGYKICCKAYPEFIYQNGDLWTIPLKANFRKRKKFSKIINTLT